LARIDECVGKLRELAGSASAPADEKLIQQFTEALDEDLNISGAWGVVFDWVRDTNRHIAEKALKPADASAALAAFEKIDTVLGIGAKAETEVPAEILALADARTAAKKAKDFKRADALREELKAKGWMIEDTPKGPKLKKL
jgi:cysteinyl-tRNA synthetase